MGLFGLTAADIQGWMQSIGVLLTGAVATAAYVQSRLNARSLRRAHVETKARVAEISEGITRIDVATNGMKKELEEKAYEAGARSTDLSTDRATEATVLAAKIIAEAAQVAADLRVVAAQTASDLRAVAAAARGNLKRG